MTKGTTWVPVQLRGQKKGMGQGGEMTQALYARMNNKTIKNNKY
jgi:hypothetical protein